MNNSKWTQIGGSFRDPAGFLFRRDGTLLRQVNEAYAPDYDFCVTSGFFERLSSDKLLIPHEEVDDEAITANKYRVLKPVEIAYISYPFEWSFSQLKDAALLTLKIQELALEFGLTLKDASAFNVQFHKGRPIFIDTLSFEKYVEGSPWIAYRQFCQHFLAPLALMAHRDLRFRQLSARYMDGIPLDWASKMLPMSSYFKYSTFAHIHMHARSQVKHQDAAGKGAEARQTKISKVMLTGIIASLMHAVERLSANDVPTEWGDYYSDTNYSDTATNDKSEILEKFAEKYITRDSIVHDLGANTGRFSRIAAKYAETVIAHDIDDMAVELHYRHAKAQGPENVLPLMLDLTNPSPAIGWSLSERSSFPQRATGGIGIALALVHHLAISNNVPLPRLAEFFATIFPTLIIEFVPKEDSQVQRLLATRKDIFDQYTLAGFEHAFSQSFDIRERCPVRESNRMMYVMTRRS